MGWTETCAVEERMRFMLAVQEHEESFAAVCRQFGVSRRVGYKWLARFEEEGAAGLFDRPRVPLHQPQRIADSIAERCLEVRRAHPTWGPLKVRAFLARKSGQTEWPAAAICCAARRWRGPIRIMSGRCWMRRSASLGCRITCVPTMARRLPHAVP